MQENIVSFLLKVALGIYIWLSTSIYLGAFFVAIIASITRIMYENCDIECSTRNFIKKLIRYVVLSFSLAIMVLHAGLILHLGNDEIIIVSAMFAFMSEETLGFIKTNWERLLVKIATKAGR